MTSKKINNQYIVMKFIGIMLLCLLFLTLFSCDKGKVVEDEINGLFFSHRTAEALLLLDSVYDENGWTLRAYTLKIEMLLNAGRIAEAKDIILHIQNVGFDRFSDYNSTLYYYYYALIFYSSNDYYNADRYWNLAIRNIDIAMKSKKSTLSDTLYYAISNLNRGLCNVKNNKHRSAIVLFDIALDWYKKIGNNAGIANTFYQMAFCYESMKDIDNALTCIDSSIRYDSNHYSSYISKGELLQQKGDYDNAINCYEKAVKLNYEEDYVVYYDLGLVYKCMQDNIKALENLEQAYLSQPNKIDILVEKAAIYIANNDNHNYVDCMKKIIGLDPNNEYALDFINKNKLKQIYEINKGLVYDFANIKNH